MITSAINVEMIDYMHISASCAGGFPSYAEMKLVKATFIGDETDAVEYYPRVSEHVNDHPYVRHLWSRVDGLRILPDMRQFEPAWGKLSI